MTVLQIQNEVQELLEENTNMITNGFFTLNKKIDENIKRIDYLQSICSHNFRDGECVFCKMKEIDYE